MQCLKDLEGGCIERIGLLGGINQIVLIVDEEGHERSGDALHDSQTVTDVPGLRHDIGEDRHASLYQYNQIQATLFQSMPPKREIKKTVIHYAEDPIKSEREERERSREKHRQEEQGQKEREKKYAREEVKVEEVNGMSRRQRLEMMRRAQQEQEEMALIPEEVQVKIEQPIQKPQIEEEPPHPAVPNPNNAAPQVKQEKHSKDSSDDESQNESEEQGQGPAIMTKPVFISKTYRDSGEPEGITEQQRKRRSIRYTTKLLLSENKEANSEEENQQTDSEFQNQTDIPNDDDTLNEETEFNLWKIRELKRIRRQREDYRRFEMQRKELQRRRQMSNQQILIQNRALGSDATDDQQQTKYVFMQKYYHKGAFYQDSEDEVFKRDYNLPTPMEMQDKSMLPKLLQKRIGNFGKKGQSKYTHLTQEDTSDLNPLTRPDESLLDYWKKRTAGYKGSYKSNV